MNSKQLFFILTMALLLLISGCSTTPEEESRYSQKHDSAPEHEVDFSAIPNAVPKVEPLSRYGNPDTYIVRGKRYYRLTTSKGYVEQGNASWYGTKFHGHRTSSGETFDMYAMTAAHKTLPLPTYTRVTNLDNGRSIIVKVNDRGPFHASRIIDLSYVAAGKLDILKRGTGRVEVVALNSGLPDTTPKTTVLPEKRLIHFIQVGAFKERFNAVNLEQKLTRSDISDTRISSTQTHSGTIYRVQIGPFTSEQEALTLSRELISHGHADTVVINEQI